MPRRLSLDETAAPLVPERPSLPKLREAAAGCTACPLHETGTQTVRSILRADESSREQEYRELVRDLEAVAKLI
jgi:hypothetical protein